MNNTAHSPFSLVSQNQTIHYQHIIRVPAGLFALKSCSCCCCPLPFKLQLFLEPVCKVFYFENCSHLWKTAGVYPKISCCQTIIFPELFCQNIMLPKYCDGKISKLSFPKYQFATICSQIDGPKSSQNNNLGRPQTQHFVQSLGVMVPVEPSSPEIQ